MRYADMFYALVSNNACRNYKEANHKKRYQGLSPAVAIGMVVIGGLTGVLQTKKNEDGRKYVGG